jgi:hypothetical protein
MRPKSLPLSLGAAFGCVTAASLAHAKTDGPTKLWLEARPFTCDAQLPALARELTLACDAAGGACVIAPSESMADRRIVLHCSEEAWTVEATSPAGQLAWSVEVYGSDADRTRSAAVFTVRAESGEPVPHHVAPAPALEPPALPPIPTMRGGPAEDRDRVDSIPSPTLFSVAAAPRISTAFGRGDTHFMSGVAGYGVVRLSPSFRVGLTGAVEVGEDDSRDPTMTAPNAGNEAVDSDSYTFAPAVYGSGMHWHLSGGAVLGVGAPFDRVPFGAMLEGTYGALLYSRGAVGPVHAGFASVRGGLVYQLFATNEVRPWLCLSARQTWSTVESLGDALSAANTYASIDLGVVWDPR